MFGLYQQLVLSFFMSHKAKPKPKLTDAERHKRFLETAREVGASDNPKDFDKAFMRVVSREDENNRGSRDRKK